MKSLSDKLGREVPGGNSLIVSSNSEPTKPVDLGLESVEDMHDKAKQAQKLGFVAGGFLVKKKTPNDIYRCTEIRADILIAQPHNSSASPAQVPLNDLFADWKPFKGKVYERIADPEAHSPLRSIAWSLDAVKGCIAAATRQAMIKNSERGICSNSTRLV